MENKNHSNSGGGIALLEALSQVESSLATGAEAVSGHLTGVDDEGRLLFRADGSDDEHPVTIGIALSDEELVHSARLERRVLVLVTSASPPRRILVGILRERVGSAARESAQLAGGVKVKVDGEAVKITGESEIELRCGKARLLMRKDGRIEISGTELVSRSRGPVKIKGATIALN